LVLHPAKKAIRALGIAESFRPKAARSVLAGVVMRTDLVVDGFVFGSATVGGDDATSAVIKMFRRLKRADVSLILLSGCIISRYNIIDVDEVARKSALPVVCLTYKDSSGIEPAIRAHFEDPEERIATYRRLGGRSSLLLHTGYRAYVRNSQITDGDAKRVLDAFTLQGVLPEPIRVAKLLARSASTSRLPSPGT
jgi:uncharacterized protein